MTRVEMITRLCEMAAELEDMRQKAAAEWKVDVRLKDITVRMQLLLKEM
jgi:hypothetical protein